MSLGDKQPILIHPSQEEDFKRLYPNIPYVVWEYIKDEELEKSNGNA